MSNIEMDKLWENLYEKHLEQVSKKIKDEKIQVNL